MASVQLDPNIKKILDEGLAKSQVFQAVQQGIKNRTTTAAPAPAAPTAPMAPPNVGNIIGSLVGAVMPGLGGATAGHALSQGMNAAVSAGASAAAPQAAAPQTNPLPSSTAPAKPDYAAQRERANRDAALQIEAQRQEAIRNQSRFASEGKAMLDQLVAMYAPHYRQNELNTTASAGQAVQGAANRGFFSSGLSANAEQQALLAGERERMTLAGQETAQKNQIQNRINLSQQELGDMLQSLTSREGQLSQSLFDQYMNQERGFNLQERGLDQDQLQFESGLNWDKQRFGFDILDRQAGRDWQSGESQLNRNWQGQQQNSQNQWNAGQAELDRQNRWDLAQFDAGTRAALQASEQAWRSGQASLDRADSRQRWEIETTLKSQWHNDEMAIEQANLQFRQNESAAERQQRSMASNGQWMSFVDEAIQGARSGDPDFASWGSMDGAIRTLDTFRGRIMQEGASMEQLYDYIKARMGNAGPGGATGAQPNYVPAGTNGSQYPYFGNTTIGPRR